MNCEGVEKKSLEGKSYKILIVIFGGGDKYGD